MKELKINTKKITHVKLFDVSLHKGGFANHFYQYLPQKVDRTLWIKDGIFQQGFYINGDYDGFWRRKSKPEKWQPDYTIDEILKSQRFIISSNKYKFEPIDDVNSIYTQKNLYIWVKPHLEIYVQKNCLKTLYFDTYKEVEFYTNQNFNANYISYLK